MLAFANCDPLVLQDFLSVALNLCRVVSDVGVVTLPKSPKHDYEILECDAGVGMFSTGLSVQPPDC